MADEQPAAEIPFEYEVEVILADTVPDDWEPSYEGSDLIAEASAMAETQTRRRCGNCGRFLPDFGKRATQAGLLGHILPAHLTMHMCPGPIRLTLT